MEVRLTLVDPGGSGVLLDTVVSAEPGTTVAQLWEPVCAAVGCTLRADTPWYVGGSALRPDSLLGAPPLLDGVVVSIGEPGMRAPRQVPGVLELHVTSGPDCGQVVRLSPGSHRVGRAAECSVRLADPDISRVHATLDVGNAGVLLRDLGSTNGTFLEGVRAGDGQVSVRVGQRVRLGGSVLQLRLPDAPPAAVRPDGEGHLAVNRSPRTRTPLPDVEIRMPQSPALRDAMRMPVVAVLVPLLLAGVLTAVTRNATMLLFALMSPAVVAGNVLSDRRAGRRGSSRARAEYAEAAAAAQARVNAALRLEESRRHDRLPDAATLLVTLSGPLARTWERRGTDDDALTVRLGSGRLPSRVTVVGDGQEPLRRTPDVLDVPVAFSLADVGVTGVVGPRAKVLGVIRLLLAQVCGWQSPVDVSLVVLAADAALVRDWAWTAYLPHIRPRDGQDAGALVGVADSSPAALASRVAELTSLVQSRRKPGATLHESGDGRGARGSWAGPWTVVLLDGAQRLRTVPGMTDLLEHGPAAGVLFVCLEEAPSRLPVETRCTVEVSTSLSTTLTVRNVDQPVLEDVVADMVTESWAERFARAVAPLRDATPPAGDRQLPDAVRLLDLVEDDLTDPCTVSRRWHRRLRSPGGFVGCTTRGSYSIDLARDGPHVLVAGTTGSGKSELLQTLITSLATEHSPEALSFVLVDYKGGSAFADCAKLPHTVGLVTDLDQHLTARALTSLEAELKFRERVFAAAAAKDFEQYHRARSLGAPDVRRLVIVIDEFRMLAEELPEFVEGLVRIAALGRSLGVHLVLATQRPAGIVSAEIRANVNLRLALRVQDRSDSCDVIETGDAADISDAHPGRALVRVGTSPAHAVQVARVAGHGPATTPPAPRVERLSWPELGDPLPSRHGDVDESGPTDLARITAACATAFEQLGIAPASSPWLTPLPDVVTLADLGSRDPAEDASPGATSDDWRTPYARLDLPAEQSQPTLYWDVATDGSLAAIGTSRTGRTTLVRTLAGALATEHSPEDVHLYAIDGAPGGLAALSRLPHTGAVVPADQLARVDRLIQRVVAEIDTRLRALSHHGFASVAEQRAFAAANPGGPIALPYLVLFVDGWDSVTASLDQLDHGRPMEALLSILRDGSAAGVRVVVTGDRSLLFARIGALVSEKVVLRLADRTDATLAGVAARDIPEHLPPGRAVRTSDGAVLQVATLAAQLDGPAQVAALESIGHAARACFGPPGPGRKPFRVEQLPATVTVTDLLARGDAGLAPSPSWALVGVGGDDLTAVGIDIASSGAAALVAGPSRSGRSTTLATIAGWLADGGRPVGIVANRRSVLHDLAKRAEVLGICASSDAARLRDWRDRHTDLVVLADDADLLLDSPVEEVLLQILRSSDSTGAAVICSGGSSELASMFRGITIEVRRRRRGVLLNPSGYTDGDLFGLRIGKGHELRPGRGLLINGSTAIPVQVALPE